jgi:hypothetical protein
MTSPRATAPPGTAASWHYHPAVITQTRRLRGIPESNNTFQDSRPALDLVFVSVLREAPTLLRYSLLIHATEKPVTTPLNQLLLQKDACSLLAVRDLGAFNPYGSFGWVLGTDQEVL